MTDANPMGADDIGVAATQISSLFQKEQVGLPTETEKKEVVKESQEPESKNEQQETHSSDTNAESQRYRVKVRGEEKDVTLDDLKKGYMMESDYRQKTSELSKHREQIEAKQRDIDERLEEAKALIDLELDHLNSPEMQELKQVDPESYLKEFDKIQSKIKRLERANEKRQIDRQAKHQELIQKEQEALLRAIPEFLDQDVLRKESEGIFKQMADVGFSQQEINQTADHRMFVLARKAMLFDQIQSQNLRAKEVRQAPKVQQSGNAAVNDESQETKNLRAELKTTGNMQTAAKLIKSLMH